MPARRLEGERYKFLYLDGASFQVRINGRERRRLRSVIPRISAACHDVILFAMARKITSYTLIARSQEATDCPRILAPSRQNALPRDRLQRTDHLPAQPNT
ncbi:MAG TPA: hypothetical protein VFZ27_04895 [Terriglobia bacterium]|nr:hypothetical protein [Terriglobia bacterium]